jgi:Lar family restriction alleviation protein
MTEKLLPCPFCGGDHIFLNGPSPYHSKGSINCAACLAYMPAELDEIELVKTWNTRVATATPSDAVTDEPFAWVIPGSDTANDRGFIDAMAWEEGEFSKPLYAHPPLDTRPSPAPAAVEAWQPISTAPKDGTEVLLWAESWGMTWGVQIGHFDAFKWVVSEGAVSENDEDFDPEAEIDENDFDDETNLGPTHWMPLPAPPISRNDRVEPNG